MASWGLLSRRCSKRPSSNSASSKEVKAGLSPRSMRMSLSCPVMQSLTSPNDIFPYEFQSIRGLPLGFTERISGGEKIRDQVDATIGYIGKVTGLLRPFESPPQEAAAHRQLLRPVDDVDAKNKVDARAEPV